jgi:hypothetical protein
LMFKECSATSLGMPGMSEGFHAKISLLAQRKSMSALSYLGESEVPMHTVLSSGPSGSTLTVLTSFVGSKEPAARLELGASYTTSRRM